MARTANSERGPTLTGPFARFWSDYTAAVGHALLAACTQQERVMSASTRAAEPQRAKTTFELSIDVHGRVTAAELSISSGDPTRDEMVKSAILGAQPYPLPAYMLLSWDSAAHLIVSLDLNEPRCGDWRVEPLMLAKRRAAQAASPPGSTRSDLPETFDGVDGKTWTRFRDHQRSYVIGVAPGNTRALLDAAAPFARYLDEFHKPLHRAFTSKVLPGLRAKGDPYDPTLSVKLEFVIKQDGSFDRMGIVGPSASLSYDVAVFGALMESGPYPSPPESIRSPDGLTYIRWNLQSSEGQCGTWQAEPYLLKDTAHQSPEAADAKAAEGTMAPVATDGAVPLRGYLTPTQVKHVVQSRKQSLVACLQRHEQGKHVIVGKLAVQWRITRSGRVAAARVVSGNLHHPGFEACLTGAIRGWVFPTPDGGEVSVQYPFMFGTTTQ